MSRPLSARMREAAETLKEVSARYDYSWPEAAKWSAEELLREAEHVETEEDAPIGEGGLGEVYTGSLEDTALAIMAFAYEGIPDPCEECDGDCGVCQMKRLPGDDL